MDSYETNYKFYVSTEVNKIKGFIKKCESIALIKNSKKI